LIKLSDLCIFNLMNNNRREKQKFQIFIKILYLISFILLTYFIIDGFSFYLTDYQQRPRHEDYRNLRPAGDFGHGVGVVGSAMMLFMLLYSLRKRTRIFGQVGELKSWLNLHIYLGIMGPLLVILHSAFKVEGLIAVSFWSMIAVALSGVLGRYLYIQIPRSVEGEAIDLESIEKAKNKLVIELRERYQISDNIIEFIDNQLQPSIDQDAGLIKSIYIILVDDLKRLVKIRLLRKSLNEKYALQGIILGDLIDISRQKSLLERKVILLNQVQQLFHYWHVFHKPFAIVMYLIMLVHVGITVWLGYSWIF